jgi:uncharacterized protein YaiI (UPF0178 family)
LTILLEAQVIEKGVFALNHRGDRYTPKISMSALKMRDFIDTLRSSGIQPGGPNAP